MKANTRRVSTIVACFLVLAPSFGILGGSALAASGVDVSLDVDRQVVQPAPEPLPSTGWDLGPPLAGAAGFIALGVLILKSQRPKRAKEGSQ